MLKRKMAAILCGILLLSGCQRGITVDQEQPDQETAEEAGRDHSQGEVRFPLVWKSPNEIENEFAAYIPSSYTPKVPEYRIQADLSNVGNLRQFQGFTLNQQKMLAENGFLVLSPNSDRVYHYLKMYTIYETNEYLKIPNFITVDASLHLYHIMFGETLKSIEQEKLIEVLSQLTDNMLYKALALYNRYDSGNQGLKDDLGQAAVYFSVANQLINGSYGDLPEELLTIAQAEFELVEEAAGYLPSPLMGHDLNYAQFVVRGHYAGDENLENYFKTMMWYGLMGFPLEKEGKPLDQDQVAKALTITYLAFLERDGVDDLALWDRLYGPTNLFVGQSDDISLFQLMEVIRSVFGENPSLEDFRDQQYESRLQGAIKALPEPGIQQRLVTGAVDTPTEKQFRFMGQRYTLDGNILQDLMFPIIRPVPTGLDVASLLGSLRASEIVWDQYVPDNAKPQYQQEKNQLADMIGGLTSQDWQQNLYNGWLWVLESLWSAETNQRGYPYFMQTRAWTDKRIQTGLGSYAELKHDTVLYAKQPAAERGGGEELIEPYPNYVEPAVEVYDRLLWLVRYTRANLAQRDLLSDHTGEALDRMESLYELFRICSIKELENLPLTEEENERLKYVGGSMEHIDGLLADDYNRQLASARISDVAGLADTGEVLEIGTGLPHEIYVLLPQGDQVYLARGVVYSYYEFLSSKPLTNQEWHGMLGIEREIVGDFYSYDQINPDKLLHQTPPQENWVGSFTSSEPNHVTLLAPDYRIE